MSDQMNPSSSGSEVPSAVPTSDVEPISMVKRNVLKAGWVVPMIAVLSLPKDSYAVVGS